MKKLAFLIPALLLFLAGAAQDKVKMEQERKALQQELQAIQSQYSKVKGQKKETLGQLNLLQKKVSVQERLVNNINREIRLLNDDIYRQNLEITRLSRQLDTLKAQYAKSVVYAYKNRSSYDFLNFVFSASSFNDAVRRMTYLKSYRAYRQEQVANIIETRQAIEDRKQQLLGNQTQKRSALQNKQSELTVLASQRNETNEVVSKLKTQETALVREINAKKKRDVALKRQISIIIQREIAARRKAEAEEAERLRKLRAAEESAASPTTTTAAPRRAPAKTESAAAIPLNAKEVALSNSFAGNKGRLPWPVDNGNVSIHYGTYNVPGTRIKGVNPGITITTGIGSSVKAVFDGEVIGVYSIGEGMVVTVSHGKYFTTYSNLTGVSVSKGQSVKTGQSLGRAGVDDEDPNGGKIDFLLMVEKNEVNPEPWLRR